MAPGQFGTKSVKEDNLAPRTIWHRNEKGTIWHRHEKGTIWHRSVKGTIWHRNEKRTIWHQDNLAPQCKRDNLAPGCYQKKKCNFKMREKYSVKWKRNTLSNLSQPSARRVHRHPSTVISPPNVSRIYPIQIYVILLYHMFLNLPLQLQLNDFFWIRCQIVRGAKLSVFCWWCQIVRCQIVLVPNCPWC